MLLRRRLRCELRRKVSRAVALGRVPSVDQLIMNSIWGVCSVISSLGFKELDFFENQWKSSRFADDGRFYFTYCLKKCKVSEKWWKQKNKENKNDDEQDLQDIQIYDDANVFDLSGWFPWTFVRLDQIRV